PGSGLPKRLVGLGSGTTESIVDRPPGWTERKHDQGCVADEPGGAAVLALSGRPPGGIFRGSLQPVRECLCLHQERRHGHPDVFDLQGWSQRASDLRCHPQVGPDARVDARGLIGQPEPAARATGLPYLKGGICEVGGGLTLLAEADIYTALPKSWGVS